MARRGLSPISAVLVLIALTVIASLVTYMWVTGYTGLLLETTEPAQLNEVLKIEEVGYSDGKLRVAVRNVGSRKTTIAALYILAQDRTAVLARTDLEVELEPGAAVNLEVDAQLRSSTYLVKLVTRTGVEAVTTLTGVKPPEVRKILLKITVDPPGGGTTEPEPGEYEVPKGTVITITAMANEGFLFSHWLINGELHSHDETITITVEEDMELTAVFLQLQPGAPKFQIVYYEEEISGPLESTATFNVRLRNVGEASGIALLKILDEEDKTVSQAELSLQPSKERSVSLTLKLPPARGEYTWRVIAYNTATGETDDEKTFTVKAKDLYLKKRNALYYTAFETMPSGWTNWGGSWTIATGNGRRGTNALQGNDDNGGPGGASLYYMAWPQQGEYVAVQLYATRPPLDRLGLAFLNGISPPVTIISVSLDYTGGDRGLAIERYDQTWRPVNETTKFKPSQKTWYTLTIRWEAPTLTAFVYDSSGALCANLSASIGDFTTRYIALIVDGKGEGYFDNFVISSQDLQYVQVSGLEQGWRVELYSGSTLIGSAVADASGVARVTVVTDLIVVNVRIVVKDSTGSVVIERSFTEIVGGDEYTYGS